jgi:hypothetical protein
MENLSESDFGICSKCGLDHGFDFSTFPIVDYDECEKGCEFEFVSSFKELAPFLKKSLVEIEYSAKTSRQKEEFINECVEAVEDLFNFWSKNGEFNLSCLSNRQRFQFAVDGIVENKSNELGLVRNY